MKNIKIKYSIGNKKIGKDTIIINMASAKNCPAGKKGLCSFYKSNKCYAMKAERQYPSVLPYREKQAELWQKLTVGKYIEDIKAIAKSKRKNRIKYVRFNESGDFKSQRCIGKLNFIAEGLKEYNIKVYTYTHRKDLNFKGLSNNLTINSSHKDKKIHNNAISLKSKVIDRVMKIKKDKKIVKCKMDCSICSLCKKTNDLKILVPLH